jgi:hypothetical protein
MRYGSLIVFPIIRAGAYTGEILQDGFALDKNKVIGAYVPSSASNYVPTVGLKPADASDIRIQISDKRSTPFIDGLPDQLATMVVVNGPNNNGMSYLPIEKGQFDRIQLLFNQDGTPDASDTTFPITLIYEID